MAWRVLLIALACQARRLCAGRRMGDPPRASRRGSLRPRGGGACPSKPPAPAMACLVHGRGGDGGLLLNLRSGGADP